MFSEYLKSDCNSSKSNIYVLLASIVMKYKTNEQYSKRIITSYDDAAEDMMDEDEVMLEFSNTGADKESDLFKFLHSLITSQISLELSIPHEDHQGNMHEYSYGVCKKPFGILRMRIIEFLAQVFQVFAKEIHAAFVEGDIYNKMLFFFEHYPFHNILH